MKEAKTPASSVPPAPVKNTGGVSLTPPLIQPKLLVGHPDDPLEHEADRAAERVVRLWQGGSFGAPAGETPAPPAAPLIQRRATSPGAGAVQASPEVTQHIQAAQGGGQPLPGELLPPLEAAFGMNFSGVRLHTDARADALNRDLQARAFTTGQHIFFRQGEFQTESKTGLQLLGHELGHVVQQDGHEKSAQRQVVGEENQVGYARVNPGVDIRWRGRHVYIHANMQLLGDFPNSVLADQMKQVIERFWNKSFPDGYRIWCTVNIYVLPSRQARRSYTHIYVNDLTRPTHVANYITSSGRYMMFDIDDIDRWTIAHEFGHILGLPDRYTESLLSRIRGLWGGERHTPPSPGWEGNLMAEVGGELQSRNVADLLRMYAHST